MHDRYPIKADGLTSALSIKVHAEGDLYVSETLRRTHQWEPYETQLVIQHLKQGDSFIDVGANIGYFTLIAADIVGDEGRVVAFEPETKNFQLLSENIAHFSFNQVEIAHAALSNTDAQSEIYLSDDNWGDHQIYHTSAPTSERERQSVQLVRGDDFLLEKLDTVNFIKIDTQGSEYQVISGLRQLITNSLLHIHMIVEFWPAGLKRAGSSGHQLLDLLLTFNLPIAIIDHLEKRLIPCVESDLRPWIDEVDNDPSNDGFMNLFIGNADES